MGFNSGLKGLKHSIHKRDAYYDSCSM